jgi:hypothetical protein
METATLVLEFRCLNQARRLTGGRSGAVDVQGSTPGMGSGKVFVMRGIERGLYCGSGYYSRDDHYSPDFSGSDPWESTRLVPFSFRGDRKTLLIPDALEPA